MASGLGKHHILEAIDKLRSRKSRPDVLRIVSYVSKKYEFPKNDIKDYLEKLSKDGTVLKVEFKGSISYRNAANYRNSVSKMVHPDDEECYNRESISDLVAGTLAQLIVEEPDYLDVGISMNELYSHIDDKYRKSLTKHHFKEILLKEVKNGNLIKFENGNYCLGYPTGDQNSSLSPALSETSQNSSDKVKESSRSPINNIRRFANFSRQSSPTSSKHSSTSSLIINEKPAKPAAARVYTKHKKEKERKMKEIENKDSPDKNDVSPVREGSRRKRFQKIVFDPSDNPKPKKHKEKEKEKEQVSLLIPKKPKATYKKQLKEADAGSGSCGTLRLG